MTQQIGRNYDRIKADAQAIINMEMERIKNDPELCRRLGLENEDDKRRETGNRNKCAFSSIILKESSRRKTNWYSSYFSFSDRRVSKGVSPRASQ